MSITTDIKLQTEFLRTSVKKPIVIVGHMGSGKTTISQKLATAFGWDFVESDKEIVLREKRSIPEIFGPNNKNEDEFRRIEREVIATLLDYEVPRIVGIGGGAFIQKPTRALIKEKAVSIYLKAAIEELYRRIGDDPNRPMLRIKETPEDSLRYLDEVRGPIYADADITVETYDEPEEETLNRVINTLYTHLNP